MSMASSICQHATQQITWQKPQTQDSYDMKSSDNSGFAVVDPIIQEVTKIDEWRKCVKYFVRY